VLIDFAKLVGENNIEMKEKLKEINKLARVEKELNRLVGDESIFPLVVYHTIQWYYGDDFHPAVIDMKQSFPSTILAELKSEKEWFAAGILKLKKKYPAIYNQFRTEWDELFQDLTKNFNREMKRELKKLR
jgi:hypothetical protein